MTVTYYKIRETSQYLCSAVRGSDITAYAKD